MMESWIPVVVCASADHVSDVITFLDVGLFCGKITQTSALSPSHSPQHCSSRAIFNLEQGSLFAWRAQLEPCTFH